MSETGRDDTKPGRSDVTVGIDIGTTSVKAVAADSDGTIVARTRIPHRLVTSTDGEFAHEPAAAWQSDIVEALQVVGADRAVRGVCVAAMVPSLGAIDATGRPIGPGLLYGDVRGIHETDPAMPANGSELAAFLDWHALHSPDAVGYWPAQAFANHALGGEGFIDATTAGSAWPLFDLRNWDTARVAQAGTSADRLPRVVSITEPGGRVLPGRPCAGAVLGGGTVDAYGEQLVSGATEPGDVLVVFGTTLITWAVCDSWISAPGLWSVPHHVPDRFLIGGPSNAGGLFVDRVDRLIGLAAHDPAPEPAAPRDVPVWLPYVRGERTPLHRRDLRASLHDIGIDDGPTQIRRAAHEASGFVVRRHLELAADAGCSPQRIVAVGGGTRSGALMQAIADATGLAVDVAAVPEGAALGAAWLARCAAGLEDDLMGATVWARTAYRAEPRAAWVAACDERYERFRSLTETAVRDADSLAVSS
ncbi:MAG: xylulose kinase [Actinobacteria bacterium]|nr:xylulose kinase [Actinomycetota bacterium]